MDENRHLKRNKNNCQRLEIWNQNEEKEKNTPNDDINSFFIAVQSDT